MELLKQSATSNLYELMYKEQEKRLHLTSLITGMIFTLIGNAIGCIISEVATKGGAHVTSTLIGISICWGILWIRYRNKIKK